LLEAAKQLPPMTPLEKRAQAISFTVGNLLCDYPDYDEWQLRRSAADHWDKEYGEVRE